MSKSRLQDELKKKRPFELPEQEAILNILRTNPDDSVHEERVADGHHGTPHGEWSRFDEPGCQTWRSQSKSASVNLKSLEAEQRS